MSISGKTKVFGLIGTPVENSYSPFIYNEAFKITGFDGRYVAFDVSSDYLANALDGIKALGISGINVTAPYKEKVMPFIDHISVTAKSIGAVNTILNEGGRLRGFNTDYIGFMRQLLDISSEFNKKKSWKFTILGAGGAARSVIYSLLFFLDYLSNNYREEAQNSFMGLDIDILTGKKIECINIVNRDQKKALNLKGMIDKLTKKEMIPVATILFNTENLADAVRNCDVFINSSPIGFKGCSALDEGISRDLFTEHHIVIDLVYNPEKKSFIEYGKVAGSKVFTGLDMLLYQAEANFYLFTGKKVSFESIKESIVRIP